MLQVRALKILPLPLAISTSKSLRTFSVQTIKKCKKLFLSRSNSSKKLKQLIKRAWQKASQRCWKKPTGRWLQTWKKVKKRKVASPREYLRLKKSRTDMTMSSRLQERCLRPPLRRRVLVSLGHSKLLGKVLNHHWGPKCLTQFAVALSKANVLRCAFQTSTSERSRRVTQRIYQLLITKISTIGIPLHMRHQRLIYQTGARLYSNFARTRRYLYGFRQKI